MQSTKLQHMESKLSDETTADEDKETAVDSKRGGWTTFPFITGCDHALTLTATIHSLTPPHCNINTNGSFMCKSPPSKLQYMVLYSALALSSIGLGGTRFTIATVGADQFDKAGDQAVFFNWCFIISYVASALSFIAIIYIQDSVSWGLGVGICVATNVIGLVVFLLGKWFYRRAKPKGSPFTTMARVLVVVVRERKKKASASEGGQGIYHGGSNGMPYNVPTKSFRCQLYTQTSSASNPHR